MAEIRREDLMTMDREALERILPVGGKQIPIWYGCAWLGFFANAAYGIALAWSMHEDYYAFGPKLIHWLGQMIGFSTRGWGDWFGTTWFVVLLNVLTVLTLRKNLRSLKLVRGTEKRSLVRQLFVSDLKGIVWSLIFLGIFGIVLITMLGGNPRRFDVIKWIVAVYTFLWGFTQKRHPNGYRTETTGRRVPGVIRIGAIGLFVSLGLLVLRTLIGGLYLLVVRPLPSPDEIWEGAMEGPGSPDRSPEL